MNNNSNILNIYKKVIKSGDLQKNPHELVKLVLTELSRTMKMISDDIEKKKVCVIKEGSSDLINIQNAQVEMNSFGTGRVKILTEPPFHHI